MSNTYLKGHSASLVISEMQIENTRRTGQEAEWEKLVRGKGICLRKRDTFQQSDCSLCCVTAYVDRVGMKSLDALVWLLISHKIISQCINTPKQHVTKDKNHTVNLKIIALSCIKQYIRKEGSFFLIWGIKMHIVLFFSRHYLTFHSYQVTLCKGSIRFSQVSLPFLF